MTWGDLMALLVLVVFLGTGCVLWLEDRARGQ